MPEKIEDIKIKREISLIIIGALISLISALAVSGFQEIIKENRIRGEKQSSSVLDLIIPFSESFIELRYAIFEANKHLRSAKIKLFLIQKIDKNRVYETKEQIQAFEEIFKALMDEIITLENKFELMLEIGYKYQKLFPAKAIQILINHSVKIGSDKDVFELIIPEANELNSDKKDELSLRLQTIIYQAAAELQEKEELRVSFFKIIEDVLNEYSIYLEQIEKECIVEYNEALKSLNEYL